MKHQGKNKITVENNINHFTNLLLITNINSIIMRDQQNNPFTELIMIEKKLKNMVVLIV